MRKQQEQWLTYKDLIERDLIQEFSNRLKIEKYFVEELIRLCDTDFRFRDNANTPEYKRISDYVRIFWKMTISRRQIQHIHRCIRNHDHLKSILKRGGKMRGSFSELVLRKNT